MAGQDPGSLVSNEIVGHHDWMPTLLAAAGMPDIKDRLLAGYTVGDRTYKVHLDGFQPAALSDRKGSQEPASRLFLLLR